ncbi:3227_t:CDS:2 [Paraglomus occultum]|uniref:Delta(14)-sterol reductase ERG24 n=1 Tax=Paraglomus occultum TaxID=144539 RepID=A0A9N8ZHH5_9GLOM|nr:3227_t:CDS:2 [Paraglomus occultum]
MSSSKVNHTSQSILNPKTTEYEFLGPIGAFLMITVLPTLVYVLNVSCTFDGCPPYYYIEPYFKAPLSFLYHYSPWYLVSLFDAAAFVAYICFLIYLYLTWLYLPGEWVEGTVLRNGKRLKYKQNGFDTLLLTLFVIAATLIVIGTGPFLFVFDHYIGLITASTIVSFAASIYVYLDSFEGDKLLALGGNTGNVIYDFMIGRELNPRIGDFDIKYLVELRPGLIGWMIIDVSMAICQYVELGEITFALFLVVVFQIWYVVDALYMESSVLTTIDITTDGFGWMLCFGNLTWLPFTYSIQARYLVLSPIGLSWFSIFIIMILKAVGYVIFREANTEKNIFRNDPNDPRVRHLKYITTKQGSRLLVSGWWGVARHINYFGDWLMAWSWCLPCGFDDIFPYFYVVYFAVLLVHREIRDETKCKNKYKKDWDRYCEIVKWRIIPGVY